MRLRSPVGRHKTRLEIIPLIDIMFFLLASFMMVSITMIRLEALKMDLPTATAARPGTRPEVILVEVDAAGDAFVGQDAERRRFTLPELFRFLTNAHAAHSGVPALIQGSPDARHGQVIAVLDACRRAGIQRVSYQVTAAAER